MVVKLIEPSDWNDDDFQRRVNEDTYYDNKRLLISKQYNIIESCIWCGQKFIKKHHSEKYCCEECRKDSRGQQSRNKSHRWYHKHKYELTEEQRWGLGSGTLSEHRHEDFEKEYNVIRKEFKRLRIKKR